MVLLTVLPLTGELSVTLGGVVSAVVLLTVTLTLAESVELLAAS
jgi:hypothetical protein